MAGFDVETITAAGASLIAAATAQNKLIIDGCDARTTVLTKEQAVQVSSRPSGLGVTTNTIALGGSTDNHVYAYAEFIRGQSAGGNFKTFYLFGHSESDPSVVRVIAVSSASTPIHLPTSTDVLNRSEIQFELTFSATDEVVEVASTSMFATRGEVAILRERTVTTHAEGEPTTGENQVIYGTKQFQDYVDFGGVMKIRGQMGSTASDPNVVAFTSLDENGAPTTVGNQLYFAETDSGGNRVQASSWMLSSVNFPFGGVSMVSTSYDARTTPHQFEVQLYAGGGIGGTYSTVTLNQTTLTIRANTVSKGIVPDANNAYDLGSIDNNNSANDKRFKNLYLSGSAEANIVAANALYCTILYNNSQDGSIKVYGDLLPTSDDDYNLGSWDFSEFEGYRWNNLYLNGNAYVFSNLYLGGNEYQMHLNSANEIEVNTDFIVNGKIYSDLNMQVGGGYLYFDDGTYYIGLNSNNEICANTSIVPYASNGYSLGKSGKQFKDLYVTNVRTNSIRGLGLSAVVEAYNDIVPSGTVNLGSADSKFYDIYATNLYGCLPSVSGTTEPEVGAILLVGITVSGAVIVNAGTIAKVGYPLLAGGNNVTAIGTCSWDSDNGIFTGLAAFSNSVGKYKLLSGVTKTSNATNCYALVMRIE